MSIYCRYIRTGESGWNGAFYWSRRGRGEERALVEEREAGREGRERAIKAAVGLSGAELEKKTDRIRSGSVSGRAAGAM